MKSLRLLNPNIFVPWPAIVNHHVCLGTSHVQLHGLDLYFPGTEHMSAYDVDGQLLK